MARFLLRRTLQALLTAAGIAVLSFLVLEARSEEAVRMLAEARGVRGEEGIRSLRASYGLDRPLVSRLGSWGLGIARGDLGESWSRPGSSVRSILAEHLPSTLALTGTGLLLQLSIGIGAAALSLGVRGTWKDGLLNALALAVNALPEFCVGLLLLWPFAVKLRWFPLSGAASAPWEISGSVGGVVLDRAHHLVLPALCLAAASFVVVMRLLLVRWEEEMGARYVTGARARGVTETRLRWGHGLRNAAGPLATAVGLSLPALVGGAVIVEQVFNWPGLGRVLVGAVAARDLPLLAGANVVFAVLVSVGGALSDALSAGIDPRVRRS